MSRRGDFRRSERLAPRSAPTPATDPPGPPPAASASDTPPLTRGQIEQKVAIWQARLGLEHWSITIHWDTHPDPADCGYAIAEVNAQDTYYHRCNMRFCPEVLTWPGDAWGALGNFAPDEILAHELIHVAQRDCDRAAMDLDEDQIHRDARDIRNGAYHEARERFVDDLARALVRCLGPA